MKIFKKIFIKIFILTFWIGVWELLALSVGQELYLPSPITVAKRLATLILEGAYWSTVLSTIWRIFYGIVIATLLGIILALFTTRSKFIHDLFYPLLTVIKATPVPSFVILAIIWMGTKKLPVFVCTLMILPIIWAAVSDGIWAIDKKHKELSKVFGFPFKKRFKLIYIPTVAPYFLSAFKTSVGLAWKAGVSAEVLAYTQGSIGGKIFDTKLYLEISELFAWTFTVILLSLLMELVFNKLLYFIGKKWAYVRNYVKN